MSATKELNAKGRTLVRQLIDTAHVADVISVCEEYCREMQAHCEKTPDLSAVGGEWKRAARYLAKAIDEVEP